MIHDLSYLSDLAINCQSECKNAATLLELPMEVNRAHFVVRNLQHALSAALAIENELRGIPRPRTSRE